MNPILDLFCSLGKKGFSTSKIGVVLVGIVSAACLVWFSAPWIVSLHGSTIPRLWSAVRSSAAPSYLFVAVNFIILTIWKLSENRTLHMDQCLEEESDSLSHPASISVKPRDLGSSLPLPLLRKPSPENSTSKSPSFSAANAEEPSLAVFSESSCVTKESEERSTASSAPTVLATLDSASSVLDTEEEEQAVVDDTGENDSLEATWNAIMQKSGPYGRPSLRTPAELPAYSMRSVRLPTTARVSDAFSEGHDEMNQLFENFIKKNHDQIRLQKPGEANHQWLVKFEHKVGKERRRDNRFGGKRLILLSFKTLQHDKRLVRTLEECFFQQRHYNS
ncbi:hypothetical protein HPP92_014379 [Vanilla planifolia]|uniref:DUF4408 domain-containing protein n=1 Tax=Vanilla planifolia TaxID=51239 RepID=A0A835UT17_VANPL|nr:hypothetical protein HPP92_014770 [Vanilla planifolia]KAG0474693.1 hypothetical protein HPP92_014379 [Vanilla planifolia]